MTPQEAKNILDAVKGGVDIPEEVILGCLHQTGDAVAWKEFADVDIAEFVEALRKSGFI